MRKTLIAALAALCGLASAAAAATTLTVGKADANASPIVPVNVGAKLGIFARHGLDLKISDFTGGSKLVQAMSAGSIDIGVAAGPLMALEVKGAPMLAICDDTPPIPFIGIALPWDSPVHALGDLKGKKIGISSAGSLTDWLAQQLGRSQGWGANGVEEVALGNNIAGVIAAFQTHQIDADLLVTSDIFEMEAKQQGRLLVPVSDFVGNIAAGAIFASDRLIKDDPQAIREFIAGWLETIRYIETHRDEAIRLEAEVTGFAPEVQAKEYDNTHTMYSNDCRFDADSLKNLERSFIDLKMVSAPPDMAKLYTTAFLPK